MCFDQEITIAGDYQSERAISLQLVVEKCSNSTEGSDGIVCKSDDEIQAWLQRKFLLSFHNQKKFNKMHYEDDTMIHKEAHL